jgi:hypothetical protein
MYENDNETPPPIVVNHSPLPDQVMMLVRLGLGYLAAYLAGKGVIDEATGSQLVAFGVMAVPALWSMYATYRKHAKLRTVANEAPNYIARVK